MEHQLFEECYQNSNNVTNPTIDIRSDIFAMSRYEMKYVLNKTQLNHLKKFLSLYMKVDEYGKTSIASLYYDTPSYLLIRTSLEKPEFKEKIRLRSYGLANKETKVFLELKRKVSGVVYKRRISLKEDDVNAVLVNKTSNNQIAKEIAYFYSYYPKLKPAFLVIYDRTAYFDPHSDLRLTIDENPRYRVTDLNLHTSMDGKPLLKDEGAILEIKVQGAMPLWLTSMLSNLKIYQSSFSKVGEAYKKEMLNA